MYTDSLLYDDIKESAFNLLQKKVPENYYERSSLYSPYNIESSDFLSEDDTENPNLKSGKSTIIMLSIQTGNTILGAGIISLPVVIRYLGIFLGTLFILLIGILSNYSVFLLLKAHQITKKNDYSSIAKAALGEKGFLFVNIMIVLNNFGICCAYFRIFGETIKNILAGYLNENNYLITNWHNYVYVIFLILILFFIVFTENLEKFEKTSFLGVIGIIIYFLGIFINFFYKYTKQILPKFDSKNFFPSGSIADLLISLPSVFLSFCFQMNTFELYTTLKNRTHRTMLKSTSIAIIFCMILYVYSGLFGFFMYKENLNDTILIMLKEDIEEFKNNHFIKFILIITNLGFLCCSTTSVPLMFFSLKNNFLGAVDYYYNLKNKKNDNNNINKGFLVSMIKKDDENENIIFNDNKNKNDDENNKNNILNNIKSRNNSDINENNEEKCVSKKTKIKLTIFIYLMIGLVTILIPDLKTVKLILF